MITDNKLWNFENSGRVLAIHTPDTPTSWTNYLFNDNYQTEVSQTLQGTAGVVEKYVRTVYTKSARYFYVLNHSTGTVFCPTTQPCRGDPDSYVCRHGLYFTKLQVAKDGVEFSAKVFVPESKPCEIWELTLKNATNKAAELSLFTAIPFENNSPMGGECRRDGNFIYKYSFPYHVYYEDKEKVEHKKAYYFMYSDVEITSYDCSVQRFFGSASRNMIPAAVQSGICANADFEGAYEGDAEFFLGAMQHRMSLKAGETRTLHIVLSAAADKEEIRKFIARLDFPSEWEKVRAKWQAYEDALVIETPDKQLDAMVNFWVKKQVILLTRLNRMSTYCPVRNQLQDALGYAMVEPREALKFALRVLRRQQYGGFLKQWYMTDGSPDVKLCLVKHSDAPVWLIICLVEIISQCQDGTIYDQLEEYIDSEAKESIYTHLVKAAEYLGREVGEHGLCLMLDGDWTDPINGAGRLGRGESTWLSMAAVYALGRLMEVCQYRKDTETYERLDKIRKHLTEAINTHCWQGDRYVCGFDDDGNSFGKAGDTEGELFLNAQTWALISGVAVGEQQKAVRRAITSLGTVFGSLLLKPAFHGWNPVWGRISIKQAGTSENGSVYCHGSMFKAYGDCVIGDGTAAYRTVSGTLPTNPQNPPERNLQCPTFVPNFYFGLEDSPNYGMSSCNYGTGTAAWLLWVVVRGILGVRREITGTHIEPVLPEDWNCCHISIDGKRYSIENCHGVG